MVIALVAIPALIAIVGVLAVLAVYGMRKYINASKTVEAPNTVGALGRDAAAAFENDRKLCGSASARVPVLVPHGTRYQSMITDWTRDEAGNAGFACLRFEMQVPQYYQYDYQSAGTSFTATARGDLDADGKESLFQLTGVVVGEAVRVPSSIDVRDRDE